jgi:hypothetical protein
VSIVKIVHVIFVLDGCVAATGTMFVRMYFVDLALRTHWTLLDLAVSQLMYAQMKVL